MIEVKDHNGQSHYLAPAAIAQVQEAGASARWHGIRSYVKTFDGKTIESWDDAADIARRVKEAQHG